MSQNGRSGRSTSHRVVLFNMFSLFPLIQVSLSKVLLSLIFLTPEAVHPDLDTELSCDPDTKKPKPWNHWAWCFGETRLFSFAVVFLVNQLSCGVPAIRLLGSTRIVGESGIFGSMWQLCIWRVIKDGQTWLWVKTLDIFVPEDCHSIVFCFCKVLQGFWILTLGYWGFGPVGGCFSIQFLCAS